MAAEKAVEMFVGDSEFTGEIADATNPQVIDAVRHAPIYRQGVAGALHEETTTHRASPLALPLAILGSGVYKPRSLHGASGR